jgi:FKBP-type peptidyl-prolyl cis-trans isomerase 2
LNKGDFVEFDYTGFVEGQVFDTTEKKVSDELHLHHEGHSFKPALSVIGSGDMLVGLEELVSQMKVGEEKRVSIPAAKAFGERNQDLVKLIPLEAFRRSGMHDPVAGQVVEIDNMPARVQSVSGGRVRVDFNHELAGKQVDYEVKVIAVHTTPEAKAKALAFHYLGLQGNYSNGVLTVVVPDSVPKAERFFVSKAGFLSRVFRHVPEVKKVLVEEEYQKPVVSE